MRRWPIDPDYLIFLLLILPLPFIGMLDVSPLVRLLLLMPVVVLQGLFVWNGLRRSRPRR
ncbi:MAG TPA: hypothetical protein VIK93_08280 [Limnochordales bacterium]